MGLPAMKPAATRCSVAVILIGLALTMLAGCGPAAPPAGTDRFAVPDDFCAARDQDLAPFLIAVDILSRSSASGVATVIDGRVVVLTNRHNLPSDPVPGAITLRNHRHGEARVTEILALGRDYALEGGLGIARDFAVLAPADPGLFNPLPLYRRGRYQGPVVIPNWALRRYNVGRTRLWIEDPAYDRLDLALPLGSSGAPVITCTGEVAGLYTAMIPEEQWILAGFKGIATPIARVIEALAGPR